MTKDEAIKILSLHLMQCGMMMPAGWLKNHGEGSDFMKAYEMALDALKNEPVQEWISVKDRLPIEEAKAYEQEWCEEYCEFLVMIERGLLPTTLYYDWAENEWFRINTALERETYKVTHWQYLPQPPKGEAK